MKNGIITNRLGIIFHYKDNIFHREDGPAIIYPDGVVEYYINGKKHRKDGPAVIYTNGILEYWIEGKLVDEYRPGFGCFEPKSREEALERLDRKERPYCREMYLADINKMWPEMKNGLIVNKYGIKLYYKDDKLHREDGPAVIYSNGNFSYWIDGKKHREGGPAVIYSNGILEYWIEGKLVDEYRPGFGCFEPKSREEAIERLNSKERPFTREMYLANIDNIWPEMKNGLIVTEKGTKLYYKDDMVHNEDEPAVIYNNGTVEYRIEGELHRRDGPAVIYSNGTLEYWIEGKFVDEYKPGFGCFYPKSREEALERLDRKERPSTRELYLADIDKIWPVKEK